MTPRSIVFVGNCQLGGLASLYRKFVADALQESVYYLPSYHESTEEQQAIAAEADLLVHQVLDFAPKIGDLKTVAKVHFVPHISGAFLWPYGGEAHPKNAPPTYGDPAGPYNAELGDTFLNKMIAFKVDPDEAVRIYQATDVATTRRVDRMKELVLDRQRERDVTCGYDFASFIDANFSSQRLFRTQNHPEEPLSRLFVAKVFERIGVKAEVLNHILAEKTLEIFPLTCAPLHPSIIAHYRMTCVDLNTRYRYFEEGGYTFAEFGERYMRYQFNPRFEEGYYLIRAKKIDEAIVALSSGLKESPRSVSGRYVLANLLAEKGDLTTAISLAQQAVDLEPTHDILRRQLDELRARIE